MFTCLLSAISHTLNGVRPGGSEEIYGWLIITEYSSNSVSLEKACFLPTSVEAEDHKVLSDRN